MLDIKKDLEAIISERVMGLGRPDLFREPLAAYSDAEDARYHALKDLIGPWHKDPGELLPGARSVISYFVPFTRAVVRQPLTTTQGAPLWGEAYMVINAEFDRIGAALRDYLAERGCESLPIAGTHTYDPKDLKSLWSHRSAAVIAGLGVFGDNRLAITAKGSGGRFCTVLTTAELEPGCASTPLRCLRQEGQECGACFKACPVQALKPDSFDRFRCHDDVLIKNAQRLGHPGQCDVCGRCISACPRAYIE